MMDDPFTSREHDVLNAMADGHFKANEIAKVLKISRRTVEHHLASMRSKIGVQSTTALWYRAERRGWLAQTPTNGE